MHDSSFLPASERDADAPQPMNTASYQHLVHSLLQELAWRINDRASLEDMERQAQLFGTRESLVGALGNTMQVWSKYFTEGASGADEAPAEAPLSEEERNILRRYLARFPLE